MEQQQWLKLNEVLAITKLNFYDFSIEEFLKEIPLYCYLDDWFGLDYGAYNTYTSLYTLYLKGYFPVHQIWQAKDLEEAVAMGKYASIEFTFSIEQHPEIKIPSKYKDTLKDDFQLWGSVDEPSPGPIGSYNMWAKREHVTRFLDEYGLEGNFDIFVSDTTDHDTHQEHEDEYSSKKSDYELRIKNLEIELEELTKRYEEEQSKNTPLNKSMAIQGINPVIRTARALAALVLDIPQLGEEPTTTQLRELMLQLEGLDGVPKVAKTLKRHLTLK